VLTVVDVEIGVCWFFFGGGTLSYRRMSYRRILPVFFSGRFGVMLILLSAVGFGCGLNYREVGPFWLPLTVWMGYRFTGSGVLLFVRRLPAIPVTVLYRRSVGGKFPAAAATRCALF